MSFFVTFKMYIVIILFLFSSFACAQSDRNDTVIKINPTIFDTLHYAVSKKVVRGSNYLDTTISRWLSGDKNISCVSKPLHPDTREKEIDSFFQNSRYLNETKDIFIRLRLNSYFYSKKNNKFNVRLNAQLPFSRCKRRWKIFIQDMSYNDEKEIRPEENSGKLGIGIRYYKKEQHGITSNYSLGLNGAHPYVRARFGLPFLINNWDIEPVQIFKYSSKYYFKEETNIYFDRFVKNNNLFRFKIHRETQTKKKGMDYAFSFEYYMNFKKSTGFRLSQTFFGNTHYKDNPSDLKVYNGINNYETSLSWRANTWRKWFYYEIRPTVNFDRKYDYKASYALRFFIDIYFGNYHKITTPTKYVDF